MARRRLQAILVSTILSLGALTSPAAALDLGPVSAETDAAEESTSVELDGDALVDSVDEELEAPTVNATLEPSETPTVEADGDAGAGDTTVETEPIGEVVDTVGDLVDETTEQLPDPTGDPETKPASDDGITPADDPAPEPSPTRTPAEPAQAAPADTRPAATSGFDRAHLSQVPASTADTSVASAPEAVVEPAPKVAPPRAAETTQLVAQADPGPLAPTVPTLLRILASVMVAGAAATWLHVNREIRSW